MECPVGNHRLSKRELPSSGDDGRNNYATAMSNVSLAPGSNRYLVRAMAKHKSYSHGYGLQW